MTIVDFPLQLKRQLSHQSRVLMAEDDPFDAQYFGAMLQKASNGAFQVDKVDSFAKALDKLAKRHYEVFIMDLNLPGSEGMDNIKEVAERYPALPVLVLTSVDDDRIAAECFAYGAQDFLPKEHVTPTMFVRASKYAMDRKSIQLQLEKALAKTEIQNKLLENAAFHDPLTKLPNRKYLSEELKSALANAERNRSSLALIFFDLDKFKAINDLHGHEVGDQVLVVVAERIKNVLRGNDTIVRMGGDEFVILLRELENPVLAYPIARHIYNKVTVPMSFGGINIVIRPSMGIASYPESKSVEELLRHSDLAMYEAKKRRDHFVHFYNHNHEERRLRQQAIESQLAVFFDPSEFEVLYQPIYRCKTNEMVGAEALLRWHSAQLGLVNPEEFFAVAEWTDSVSTLFDLVFERVLQIVGNLAGEGLAPPKISMNVTTRQFADNRFSQRIIDTVKQNPAYRDVICLEITERHIVENIEQCRMQLQALKAAGIKVAVDDYGTGFSSITHLKQFPIDIIKIDRSLATDLELLPENLALTAGIIEMAHRLNMEVVAEGIETEADWNTLKALDCDYVQGFLRSEPISGSKYKKLWRKQLH